MSAEAGTSHLGKSPRYLRLLSLLLLVASPVLVMLLLSLMSGQNMFLSKPIFNDEMSYWRLMYSISERGFDFGSTEHLVGYVAPYGPLGSHGLSPVAAWLWYVLLFPMTDSALVIAGVIMLSAALLLMYIIARPGISETLLIALFTLLYPPLVRYINLSMMEMPCYACVIVYMALLLRYEKEQSGALPRSFWTLPLLFVCGLYCTLLRMSNVVLFFPAILIFCHNRLSLKLLLCLVLYALGTLAFNYCFSLFVAPYPDALYTLMQSDSLAELLRGLWLNTRTNIINYLDPFSDGAAGQDPAEERGGPAAPHLALGILRRVCRRSRRPAHRVDHILRLRLAGLSNPRPPGLLHGAVAAAALERRGQRLQTGSGRPDALRAAYGPGVLRPRGPGPPFLSGRIHRPGLLGALRGRGLHPGPLRHGLRSCPHEGCPGKRGHLRWDI